MKKLLIFNWKMAPQSLGEAISLFKRTRTYADNTPKQNKFATGQARINAEIVVCPPFLYLANLKTYKLKNLKLGAQDVFWENFGAYTGEISPAMLKNSGVEYVIIGHSERRQILGETDEMINKKVLAALKAGLKVVLCVGEPNSGIKYQVSPKHPATAGATGQASIKQAKNYIKNQLKKDLAGIVMPHVALSKSLITAYEPIWAIGTGKNASPEYVLEIIKFIKKFLISHFSFLISPKVLYGGSVTGKNIGDYLKYKEIDGALIGGASLKPKEVSRIVVNTNANLREISR